MACECCAKASAGPVHVETVVQAGLDDPEFGERNIEAQNSGYSGSRDTISNLCLSMDGDAEDAPVAALGSQSSSAGLHLSLGLQDMKLLRGTNLVEVLSGFGSELRPNSLNQSLTPKEATALYRKSTQVKKVDYFISHCWKDERFAKVIALYIHENLTVAMVSSTIVAAILTALTRLKVLPVLSEGEGNFIDHFPWALCGGMSVFFVVLFNWHYVSFMLRPKAYFLDKFCVHQGDDELKQLGVRSFAGFVASSDHMLLLWTTQYFTRLWCTLELAALVKSRQMDASRLPLKIMPLQLAKVGFFTWVTVFMIYAVNQINRVLGRPLPDLYILGGALLVGSFVLVRALRHYAHDRKAMHHQMDTFSVQDAKCSDDRDRRWVERSMLRWFADLELCNLHIRQAVRDQAEEGLGPERHIKTELVMPVFLVNLFNEADYFAGGYYDQDFRIPIATLGFGAFVMGLMPFGYRLAFCFSEPRKWYVELLINGSLSFFLVLIAVGTYVTTHNVVANPDVHPIALAFPAAEIAAVLWLQRRSFTTFRTFVRDLWKATGTIC